MFRAEGGSARTSALPRSAPGRAVPVESGSCVLPSTKEAPAVTTSIPAITTRRDTMRERLFLNRWRSDVINKTLLRGKSPGSPCRPPGAGTLISGAVYLEACGIKSQLKYLLCPGMRSRGNREQHFFIALPIGILYKGQMNTRDAAPQKGKNSPARRCR